MLFKNKKFLGAVTVGERGQIVIPAAAREALNIKAGDKLLVFHNNRTGGLTIVDPESLAVFLSEAIENLSEFEKSVSAKLPTAGGEED